MRPLVDADLNKLSVGEQEALSNAIEKTSSRATMCSTPSVRNIWWNIPTCSTHGPTWTLEGQACRGERTDAKPSANELARFAEVRRRKTNVN